MIQLIHVLCTNIRFLHRGTTHKALAGRANCSLHRVKDAIKKWVPSWFKIAKACTRLTWLGKFPEAYEDLQPINPRSKFDFHFVNLDGKVCRAV